MIQEHHATALHWDFRLERDGVLVSWAVPRGVPHSYKRNNLAIMTEDHPMEYATFEGTIPAGEYGGGSVTIWDDGRYELEKWRDDEVIFTAEGRPGGPLGRVRLALIRTDGEGEKSTWLLHRMKTDAEGRPQPDGVAVEPARRPTSRAGRAATRSRGGAPRREPTTARPTTPRSRRAGSTLQPALAAEPAADAPLSWPPTAADLRPMLSTERHAGPRRLAARRWGDPAWVEVKWDGIRADRRLGRPAAAALRAQRQRHHREVPRADGRRRRARRPSPRSSTARSSRSTSTAGRASRCCRPA